MLADRELSLDQVVDERNSAKADLSTMASEVEAQDSDRRKLLNEKEDLTKELKDLKESYKEEASRRSKSEVELLQVQEAASQVSNLDVLVLEEQLSVQWAKP